MCMVNSLNSGRPLAYNAVSNLFSCVYTDTNAPIKRNLEHSKLTAEISVPDNLLEFLAYYMSFLHKPLTL